MKLIEAKRNKKMCLFSSGIVFLQDNAPPPDTAGHTNLPENV